MSKNFKFYAIIWSVMLAIFNIAVFVSPAEAAEMNKFGGAFWSGYIFITIAFIGQLVLSYIAFQAKNLQKFFYKIPLIRISWSGLILTLIFGVLCMVIYGLPNWVGIILCFAILGFNAISLAKASLAAELVEATDEKVKTQTFFIRSLTVDAESLMARAKNDAVKAECKKVYEAVRYSDPMSYDDLASLESQITIQYHSFAQAVENDDYGLVVATAKELNVLISNRNQKCQLLK